MKPLDDPFYYLANFEMVLDWLSTRYHDLLDDAERAFIAGFAMLPKPSRALLVRMVMRKGELFRADKLRYPEIGDTAAAAQPLLDLGWVDPDPELSLDALFRLFTQAELRSFLEPSVGAIVTRHRRKAELLAALRDAFPEPRHLDEWAPDRSGGVVYGLGFTDLYDRFRLMFFGNLRQDWSEFVLADLGLYRYETVPFSAASRAFQQRNDIDAYLHLHRCRERLEADDSLPVDILDQIPPPFTDNVWLEARRDRLVFLAGQRCERSRDTDAALRLYQHCSHPEARIRRLRVLERTGQLEAALELAGEVQRSPGSEAEQQHLNRLLPRLQRKLGLAVVRPPRGNGPATEHLRLPGPHPARSVEVLVAEHLDRPEAPVYYVENGLINSLFGLLCWEPVFAPLTGAFFHPFHSGPADLLRPDFHSRRAALFSACLAQLDDDRYRETIRHHFRSKHGLQSPFVYWGLLDEILLDQALRCFPPAHLKMWFQRLLRDIRQHRAGMPDLIQFWPAERRYRMIEVKGPGDRLQDNQRRWLDFCDQHRMPAVVCHVEWADTPAGGGAWE